MHSYSIDKDIRRTVYCFTAAVAILLPALLMSLATQLGVPASVGFPIATGTLLALLHLVWDHWLWKQYIFGYSVADMIGVPNLNGIWEATGVSSFVDPATNKPAQFKMIVTIRQTFSRIEVFTETAESTSRSTLAGLCVEHAVGVFRYAFENTPKNMAAGELQRHPGLIELRLRGPDDMAGDYFSGKHRLRWGELELRRTHR